MDLSSFGQAVWDAAQHLSYADWIENKFARAIGMAGIVWVTIWIIALVYSGYARDSDLGPIGVRPHTNRKLGESKIVFDQTIFPFQMDGVEATCTFFYVYEDRNGKTRKVRLGDPETLQLHIRSSAIPRDPNTHYGFEGPSEVATHLVFFPTFDRQDPPDQIEETPPSVGEYVAKHGLVERWTEDDEAPIVSVGATRWELLTDSRATFIRERAAKLDEARKGNILQKMLLSKLDEDRPNVFGAYHIKMQFSKDPRFVLFKHPNRELKMTAWLTVLTSFFSIAMDLWPVDRPAPEAHAPPQIERAASLPNTHPQQTHN